MPSTGQLPELSPSDQQMLTARLVAFAEAWQANALSQWVEQNLPAEQPLRQHLLTGLARIDLERRWQAGEQPTVESYLARYPELGTTETVAPELIGAEYRARERAGARPVVSEFAARFPRQASQFAALLRGSAEAQSLAPLSFEQPPSAAARDTAGPARAAETALSAPPPPATSATASAAVTAAPAPTTDASTGLPERFGRYRILKKLGQGGMGTVYLAADTQLDRQVALKVPQFTAQDGHDAVERFLREARAAATIQHPNLCPVYDVGQIDGTHYMTMAYIDGHLLSAYIRPNKPVPPRKAASVIRKVAQALQEAHAQGIIHRDLKPTNIFVNQRNEPVVMDFGLARRAASVDVTLTQSGTIVGTPAYMSPEQARSQADAVGPRSDVYSLGVILYEMLTSRRPYRGQMVDVLCQIVAGNPERPTAIVPGLDPRIEAICLKAMAKNPDDRYASMAEFAEALTDYMQVPQPVSLSATEMGLAPAETDGSPASRSVLDLLSVNIPELAALTSTPQPSTTRPPTPLEKPPRPPALRPRTTATAGSVLQAQFARLRVLPPWILIATGAAALALLLLGIILLIPTSQGMVKIELSDPQAQVAVQVDGQDISISGLGQPLKVRAGEHGLVVSGEGFETETRKFSVKRGEQIALRIELVPKPSAPAEATADTPADEPKPKPESPKKEVSSAVYAVQIEPPDARLAVSGEGATVVGEGPQRTVTVANPDGVKKIVLLATKSGFRTEEREFQPEPGAAQDVMFRLQPATASSPAPNTLAAKPATSSEPAEDPADTPAAKQNKGPAPDFSRTLAPIKSARVIEATMKPYRIVGSIEVETTAPSHDFMILVATGPVDACRKMVEEHADEFLTATQQKQIDLAGGENSLVQGTVTNTQRNGKRQIWEIMAGYFVVGGMKTGPGEGKTQATFYLVNRRSPKSQRISESPTVAANFVDGGSRVASNSKRTKPVADDDDTPATEPAPKKAAAKTGKVDPRIYRHKPKYTTTGTSSNLKVTQTFDGSTTATALTDGATMALAEGGDDSPAMPNFPTPFGFPPAMRGNVPPQLQGKRAVIDALGSTNLQIDINARVGFVELAGLRFVDNGVRINIWDNGVVEVDKEGVRCKGLDGNSYISRRETIDGEKVIVFVRGGTATGRPKGR